MENRGKVQSTVGKTAGLSAKKAGSASGHVFRITGDDSVAGERSGLAKVTGRGLKKASK